MLNFYRGDDMKYGKYLRKPEQKSDLPFYISLIAGLLIFLFIFQPIRVKGESMENTLVQGDLLLMERNWLVDEYSQGDVIIISKPQYKDGTLIVKRIIAVEGQVVDIDNETGTVFVDGIPLEEPYASTRTYTVGDTVFPLTVNEGCVFVLGDNRGDSMDSRFSVIGQVSADEIQGKVTCLMLPGNGSEKHPLDISRIGTIGQ